MPQSAQLSPFPFSTLPWQKWHGPPDELNSPMFTRDKTFRYNKCYESIYFCDVMNTVVTVLSDWGCETFPDPFHQSPEILITIIFCEKFSVDFRRKRDVYFNSWVLTGSYNEDPDPKNCSKT